MFPTRGPSPALVDVVAGRISFLMSTGFAMAKPHIDSGKVRALALTGQRRADALLDVLARLAALNMEPMISTPEEFGDVINTAIETWVQVIKPMNILVE